MIFEKVKFLEWGEDRWGSRNGSVLKYDKVEHFLRDLGISVVFGFIPALGEILEYLRSTIKYEDGGDEYFIIRNKIIDILKERGIDVESL